MGNFWDYSSWSGIFLIGILLGALLIGNILKKAIPFLRESLVPTSVLAGIVILIFTSVYKAITGEVFFDTGLFNGRGTAILELITYHALALGFIASSLKTTGIFMQTASATNIAGSSPPVTTKSPMEISSSTISSKTR